MPTRKAAIISIGLIYNFQSSPCHFVVTCIYVCSTSETIVEQWPKSPIFIYTILYSHMQISCHNSWTPKVGTLSLATNLSALSRTRDMQLRNT